MQKKFEDIYIIRPVLPYELRPGDRLFIYNETEGKSQYVNFKETKKAEKGENTVEIVTDTGKFTQHDTEIVYQAWQLKPIIQGIGLSLIGIGLSALLYMTIIR